MSTGGAAAYMDQTHSSNQLFLTHTAASYHQMHGCMVAKGASRAAVAWPSCVNDMHDPTQPIPPLAPRTAAH